MSEQTLRRALADLDAAGEAAGLPAGVARTEGLCLAAAVAESSPGAPAAWMSQTDAADLAAFFTAASAGRRWRTAPTDQLQVLRGGPHAAEYAQALGAVVRAGAALGDPGPHVAPRAAATAAIQLNAVQPTAAQPDLAHSNAAVHPDATSLRGSSGPAGTVRTQLDAVAGMNLDLTQQLQEAQSSLQALRPDLPEPSVPTLEGILGALGRTDPSITPAVTETGDPTAPAPQDGEPAADTATDVKQEAAAEAAAEAPPEKSLQEMLDELDTLIGLTRVKAEVRRQVELLRIEKLRVDAGLTRPTLTRHLVFVGNPGTGKTTVARLISGIYRSLGLLSKGHLIEVDRSELVAGYLGQTAMKTAEVVASAVGGVLFIDEAYALTASNTGAGADSYGQEAVNTLVKEMEDNRDDLVVIVAGYPVPMAEFVAANPGLESRFSTTITFEDYTDSELRSIFAIMAKAADFIPTPETLERVSELCSIQLRGPSFGNARYVRNVLDSAIARHAWRLREVEAPTIEQLQTLLPEDLISGDDDSGAVEQVIVDSEQQAADIVSAEEDS